MPYILITSRFIVLPDGYAIAGESGLMRQSHGAHYAMQVGGQGDRKLIKILEMLVRITRTFPALLGNW